MRYDGLKALENNLRLTGNNGEYTLRKISVPVPGESLRLEGFFCTPVNRSGYYYAVEHPKKRIVIHYTAGQLRSDLGALTRDHYHVSVAFVIARDGTIYQLFPSKNWSGHIGKGIGNTGTGNAQDKCTIGIELSNYGYLTERDENLETCYSRLRAADGSAGRPDIYCPISEETAYLKTDEPFRGQSFYANYTEQQYNSLIILLRYLTATYNIPREFLPEPIRYQAVDGVVDFHGIVSHINYRKDGKWDIGPAFNWRKIIEGVQASEYHPLSTRSFEGGAATRDADTIISEKELDEIAPPPELEKFEDEEYEELQRHLSDETGANDLMPQKRKLYALLVGIGDYRNDILLEESVRFPRLRGCVNDVQNIKALLTSNEDCELHVVELTNEQASKQEITRHFFEHLGQAGKGDIAFFYYSGHGTQEWADGIWTSDPDGKLECLACYYDEVTKDDFLLADKELRYMISSIAKKLPHIVTVFDCCHSGENTRNAALNIAVFEDALEKRIPFCFKKRSWDKFIFSEKIDYETVGRIGEAAALPEGIHIQLSACESDESAMEVGGEGVFTKAMLKVLRTTGGDITYHALRSRIRQYLRNVYEQKPRIYVAGGSDELLYTTFLNRSAKSRNTFGEVVCDERGIWTMNLGAIAGISLKNESVRLLHSDTNEPAGEAKVGNIKADYSQLIPEVNLDKSKVYFAHVEGLLSKTLKVYLENINGPVKDLQSLADTLTSEEAIILENEESSADYCVRLRNGSYYITRPGDPFRPLTIPVDLSNENSNFAILGQLMHLSQWQFIRNLANEDVGNKLSADAIQVEIFQVKTHAGVPLDISVGDTLIEYDTPGDTPQALIKIRLTNTLDVPLYCCMPYLTVWFGSMLQLLNPHVYMLPPKTTINIPLEGGALINTLQQQVRLYNWQEQIEHLKFIFSTEEFDGARLSLNELPAPPLPLSISEATRGGFILLNQKKVVNRGWTTRIVTLRFQNPFYNTVRQSDLDTMLGDSVTADFALGLYFDADVDNNMQPVYTLKREIQVVGGKAEKGLIQDSLIGLANSWARRRRNRHYKEMLNKFPGKIKIVAEGDSWFQHPLVTDIIDHVSRLYPVYCVAAAADTLRNYLSASSSRGDYFLDALQKERPSIFLLSGGGNDILGSQFRGYLKENPGDNFPEGENARRFLKDALFEELKSLMEIYRTLFNHVKTEYPRLCVLVHGYDYPVKLDDPGKGWLGKYMIEKGIDRPGDRKAVVRFIMDTFNDLLKNVADEFAGQVFYIDVRNTVRYNEAEGVDQWYDEIHPDHDGFQQVAMKFIQQMDAIVKERFMHRAPAEAKDVLRDGQIFSR